MPEKLTTTAADRRTLIAAQRLLQALADSWHGTPYDSWLRAHRALTLAIAYDSEERLERNEELAE